MHHVDGAPELFNGRSKYSVRSPSCQNCPELKLWCGHRKGIRPCECAVRGCAENHACGEVFVDTPVQIVKRSFIITLSVSRSHASRSRSAGVSGLRSEVLKRTTCSFSILLMLSLNYFHFANCSNFATASWHFVATWEYCLCVDEHVLDANHWLSANRDAWW